MRGWLLACGFVGGCTPIYDAQYDDRRRELEAFRTEFQPAENRASLLDSDGARLFWVDTAPPDNITILHSVLPGDPNSQVDYTFNLASNDLEIYRFNDDIIVDCDFGTAVVHAVGQPDAPLGSESGFQNCAIEGATVYAPVGGENTTIRRWTPPAAPVDNFFAFADVDIASAVNSFAIEGDRMVAVDATGDLYTVDLAATTSKWLRNDEAAIGQVYFDDLGVLYEASSGLRYIELADVEEPPERSFAELVADGGYHLNFKHGDIQEPAGAQFTVLGRHVIYRGRRGIFAYGLDTRNVIDLLLDEGESIDTVIEYGDPAVTAGGQLFVRSGDGFDLRDAVFQVDLSGRLR